MHVFAYSTEKVYLVCQVYLLSYSYWYFNSVNRGELNYWNEILILTYTKYFICQKQHILWLWINLLFPWNLSSRGNFKIPPFHCGWEWVLVLLQFPWQQEILFSDRLCTQKSDFPGLFWIHQFAFSSLLVFWISVLNPLTPFSSLNSALFLLRQDRQVFSYFHNFSEIIWFSVLISEI